MSETPSLVEELQSEIREILAPLIERYGRIEKGIESREKELGELRSARTQLGKVIRSIDPDAIPPSKFGPKKNGKKSGHKVVGAERTAAFGVWLQEHADEVNAMNDGKGFHSAGLFRERGDEIGLPDSSMSAATRNLHEQGLLRLNAQGSGGSKFYKVVLPPGR